MLTAVCTSIRGVFESFIYITASEPLLMFSVSGCYPCVFVRLSRTVSPVIYNFIIMDSPLMRVIRSVEIGRRQIEVTFEVPGSHLNLKSAKRHTQMQTY